MKRKLEKNFDYNKEVLIEKEATGDTYFEIGNEITTDISEAVAIMIFKVNFDDNVWETKNNFNKNVSPKKALYWLSGGHKEWKTLDNYKKGWHQYSDIFLEEYGDLVKKIIKRSKTLKDIRDGFLKYMNLEILYDFSIGKGIVK